MLPPSHTNGAPVETDADSLARRQQENIEARAKRNAKAQVQRERNEQKKTYDAGTYGGDMTWG